MTNNQNEFQKLDGLIQTLRGENGCPWDKKQTPQSMSKYLLEETNELIEAIFSGIEDDIKEELGDVLFLVFFVCRLMTEKNCFTIKDVVQTVYHKMIHRHPHVFGNVKVSGTQEVLANWQRIKQEEKKQSSTKLNHSKEISLSLPALLRAYRVSDISNQKIPEKKMSRDQVIETIDNQWNQLKNTLKHVEQSNELDQLIGQFIFSIVHLCHQSNLHPEIIK